MWVVFFLLPSLPFVLLLSLFKRFGDGGHNGSGMAEFFFWSFVFAIPGWVIIIASAILLWIYIIAPRVS